MYSLVPLLGRTYASPNSTNLTLAWYINCAGLGVVVNVGDPSAYLQGLMKILSDEGIGVS